MATPLPISTPEQPEAILFRPSKKRKIYRQRDRGEDNEAEQVPSAGPQDTISPASPANATRQEQTIDELIHSSAVGEGDEVEGVPVTMTEILRLRKKNKRLGGVEFKAEGPKARNNNDGERGVTLGQQGDGEADSSDGGIVGGPRRFAPQTGTVGDVNKHMMAYIDSQLARRHAEALVPRESNSVEASSTVLGDATVTPVFPSVATPQPLLQRQPAALGKLQEVDLGAEARALNEERTRRKIAGERSLEEEEAEANAAKKTKKVRLGPDGKPWRGRRKRRGSEDVKRDMLVEELLRENRLELYDEGPEVGPDSAGGGLSNDDGAADDRIAEAFRQEFMDAMAQKRQKKPASTIPVNRTAAGKKEEEALKGPKLGGSRNMRAAMRDAMVKAGKK